MSVVEFHQEKKFKCPCGCNRELILTIQHTEAAGWNAFVSSAKKDIVEVGENNLGD